jgi:hypothetical protein
MAEAEAPATSATLYAVHKHVGSRCGSVSAAFMACKAADQNPEACLKQGAAVTSCVVGLCAPAPRRRRAARRAARAGAARAAASPRSRARSGYARWRMAPRLRGARCAAARARLARGARAPRPLPTRSLWRIRACRTAARR